VVVSVGREGVDPPAYPLCGSPTQQSYGPVATPPLFHTYFCLGQGFSFSLSRKKFFFAAFQPIAFLSPILRNKTSVSDFVMSFSFCVLIGVFSRHVMSLCSLPPPVTSVFTPFESISFFFTCSTPFFSPILHSSFGFFFAAFFGTYSTIPLSCEHEFSTCSIWSACHSRRCDPVLHFSPHESPPSPTLLETKIPPSVYSSSFLRHIIFLTKPTCVIFPVPCSYLKG